MRYPSIVDAGVDGALLRLRPQRRAPVGTGSHLTAAGTTATRWRDAVAVDKQRLRRVIRDRINPQTP